uniref:S-formylglutathione hydrolase n=1 Tax=Ciona savignyi TaxID=51511 RepID=H2YUD2_CIOSA
MSIKEVASNRSFGGWQKVYQHESLGAEIKKCPALYYLSGLTCTEQNVVTKGGTQGPAAKNGIVVITPDTSPRGCNIEGENDSYDFGSGAGFYVNATEDKWKTNYRMFAYVTKELPQVIRANFGDKVDGDKMSIFGHSTKLYNFTLLISLPSSFKTSLKCLVWTSPLIISAFAPITNPIQCPWGQKALKGYLGDNIEDHKEYDSCELVKKYKGPVLDILIDQGTNDEFLKRELFPDHFQTACADAGVKLNLRLQEGYDHSYYFMSSFMEDHINHHAKYLNA